MFDRDIKVAERTLVRGGGVLTGLSHDGVQGFVARARPRGGGGGGGGGCNTSPTLLRHQSGRPHTGEQEGFLGGGGSVKCTACSTAAYSAMQYMLDRDVQCSLVCLTVMYL
jgi:hypothetical protein